MIMLHSTMDDKIDKIVTKARFRGRAFLRFSIFDTVNEDGHWDIEKWTVDVVDFNKQFAPGRCVFWRDWLWTDKKFVSEPITNPKWSDVIVAAEKSIRFYQNGQIDHVFLEAVKKERVVGKTTYYEMHFGS